MPQISFQRLHKTLLIFRVRWRAGSASIFFPKITLIIADFMIAIQSCFLEGYGVKTARLIVTLTES